MNKRYIHLFLTSAFLIVCVFAAGDVEAYTTTFSSDDQYDIQWEIEYQQKAYLGGINIPLSISFIDTQTQKKPSGGTFWGRTNGLSFSRIVDGTDSGSLYDTFLTSLVGIVQPALFFKSTSGGIFDTTVFDAGRFDSKEYEFKIDLVPLEEECPSCIFDDNGPSISLTAKPSLINLGMSTTLQWELHNVYSCSIDGTNEDVWDWDTVRVRNSIATSVLNEATTYTLTCTGDDDQEYTDSVTIRQVPVWQEF